MSSTIDNLPSGSPAQVGDELPIQRGASNFKITVADIVADVPATSPGGTTGNIQYNNAGAFGGFADGTSHQVLHGGRTFSAVDLTADITGALPAVNVGVLPASKITSGQLALAQGGTGVDLSASGGTHSFLAEDASHVISARQPAATDISGLATSATTDTTNASNITSGKLALAEGGTNVDLSASGSTTAVLAQDASHVVSARSLVAADIPNLDASKVTTGTLALARGGTAVDLSASGSSTAILAQDASHVISARALVAADLPIVSPTAGTGWFFGASGIQGIAGDAGDTISGVANQISGCMVQIPFSITVRKVTIRTVTGVAASTANFAIYTSNGNTKLIDASVSTASSAANVTATLGSAVTLNAGVYLFAYACSSTSVTAIGETIPHIGTTTQGFLQINATRGFVGTANPLSGTTMPATLGALTQSTSQLKIMALFES